MVLVLGLADAITVFRNGRKVATGDVRVWTKTRVVEAMLGEEVGDIYHRRPGRGGSSGEALLRAAAGPVPGAVPDRARTPSSPWAA